MEELLKRLNRLKQVPRTGWLLCDVPLSEVEDVAQHTFDVVAMTLLLSQELVARKMDLGKALAMAAVHDWPESIVGDIPYPARRHFRSGEKARIEEKALRELLEGLRFSGRCLELWKEYSEGRSPEARLVHMADYLSIMVQALKHRQRGNSSSGLRELWRAVLRDIAPYLDEFPGCRRMVRRLDREFREI
ncbi:MAG: HD domain-containing protein [Candidatus Hadarchaeales archaeon]